MVLESQSLWKMGLARRGNEKPLAPFGGGRGKERGSQLGEGRGPVDPASPRHGAKSLLLAAVPAAARTLCVPQIHGLNLVPRVMVPGGGAFGGE